MADKVSEGKRYTAKPLSEPELEAVVLNRSVVRKDVKDDDPVSIKKTCAKKHRIHAADRKTVHGCAFAGALFVTLSVEGLATVLHAPRDCAHYAVQMVTNAMRRSFTSGGMPISPFARPNVKCSDMDDPDMIFGSVGSLESSVKEMISRGNSTVAIVTSCPSGIIGEDIEGMIFRIRSEYPDVTIVPIIEDGNIKGDYMQGATDACIEIIRALAVKGKKERAVNLVGVKTFGINTKDNISFVSEILGKMGIKVNCTCVGDTDIESIRNIPNAELCMLMTPDTFAVETMNFMKDNYGLRSTENIARPGMKETELWIREVGEHFGESEKAEQIIKDLRKEFSERLEALRKYMEGRKVYVVGMKRDIGWITEAAAGCGADIVRCVVMDAVGKNELKELEPEYSTDMIPGGMPDLLKEMKDRTERILDPYIRTDTEKEAWIRKDIKETKPDILLSMYPADPDVRTYSLPVNPDVTPFAGPDMAEELMRVLKAPKEEGWRKDVV